MSLHSLENDFFSYSNERKPRFSQDIDFEGFQKFLDLFLDCDTPAELSKHLFLSFLRPYQSQITGNSTLSCMAAISSTTACAPVTSHNTRGIFAYLIDPFLINKKLMIMIIIKLLIVLNDDDVDRTTVLNSHAPWQNAMASGSRLSLLNMQIR